MVENTQIFILSEKDFGPDRIPLDTDNLRIAVRTNATGDFVEELFRIAEVQAVGIFVKEGLLEFRVCSPLSRLRRRRRMTAADVVEKVVQADRRMTAVERHLFFADSSGLSIDEIKEDLLRDWAEDPAITAASIFIFDRT